MKKRIKVIISAALTAAALFALFVPTIISAEEEPSTPKEEVVYVSINADGSVREINVVNIFDPTSDRIVDYGEYESLRNMSTTDKLSYSDGKISADGISEKLYYEGKLKSVEMPWNISVKYDIDGKEYKPSETAGKSGKLTITAKITKNESCRGSFFDAYALQASITLDGNKCKNIVAEGATVANVGADKQLTYIILPGRGAEITITADVTEFETDGFSINGIPLNISVDIDDSELNAEIKRLLDAVRTIDDGAGALADGSSQLKDGVDATLTDGIGELKDGALALKSGADEIVSGGKSLKDGAFVVSDGAAALEKGIKDLTDGIEQIESAVDQLDASSSTLTSGSAEFKSALNEIKSALAEVSFSADEINELISASSKLKSGINMLASGASMLRSAIGADAYRASMSSRGLDIDELKNNNTAAIEALNAMIADIRSQIVQMKAAGLDTSKLEAQAEELSSICTLLAANNSNIDGIDAYLTSLGSNMDLIVNGTKTLSESYAKFDEAINELADTLKTLIYKMGLLSEAINTLADEYEKLDSGINEYTFAVASISAGFKTLSLGTKDLISGSSALSAGAAAVYKGADTLSSGIGTLADGIDELDSGVGELDSGVASLSDAIKQVKDGADALKTGTSAMRTETDGLESKVGDKINDMIGSITGDGEDITSFVSDSNTDVKSVQFVIKTDGVHGEATADTEPAKTEELNFWQKLLRLFGLY